MNMPVLGLLWHAVYYAGDFIIALRHSGLVGFVKWLRSGGNHGFAFAQPTMPHDRDGGTPCDQFYTLHRRQTARLLRGIELGALILRSQKAVPVKPPMV